MRHIANKHDEHPNQLYNKCAHVELEPREWIPIGYVNVNILWVQALNLLEANSTSSRL